MDFNPQEITLCTTCMNRNEYLLQALPSWLDKNFNEIVIVDWSSQDPVLENIRSRFPKAKKIRVLRVEGKKVFNTPQARNLSTDFCGTPFILLIDSDVRLTYDPNKKFVRLDTQVFYHGSFLTTGAATTGTCLISREVFSNINGYSEFIETLPGEDLDLYKRAQRFGARKKLFPYGSLKHIYHPYELRTKYRPWSGMSRAKATIVANKKEPWTATHTRTNVEYTASEIS
jgi:glycosyltransferase involved in cell wall biosynthesis